jgi:transcription antitermination factor NusG
MVHTNGSPVLVVDNDAEPWSVIHCGPAAEFKVREALIEHGLNAYVTTERVWRGLGPRRRPHERPLIRGYVFAQLGDKAHLLHEIGNGARVVVGRPGDTAKFVAALRLCEAAGDYDHARVRKAFEPGDKVRMKHGAFINMTGTISRLSAGRRITVMLNAVGIIGGGPTKCTMDDVEELREDEAA